MHSTRLRLHDSLFMGLIGAAFLACVAPPEPFLDGAHRSNFALQTTELRSVQFYLSEEILAHEIGPTGSLDGPEHVFVVERGTRGAVTDAGPHWLRVSVGSGEGLLFLANPQATPDSIYLLATDGEAGAPPTRVQAIEDRVVRVGARRFRVIRGSRASLLIDVDDLARLVETRVHAPGREAD